MAKELIINEEAQKVVFTSGFARTETVFEITTADRAETIAYATTQANADALVAAYNAKRRASDGEESLC